MDFSKILESMGANWHPYSQNSGEAPARYTSSRYDADGRTYPMFNDWHEYSNMQLCSDKRCSSLTFFVATKLKYR